MVSQYNKLTSISRIAADNNTSPSVIRKVLIEADVEIRGRGRYSNASKGL